MQRSATEANYSINLVLLTIRKTELAREIIDAGLSIACRFPGVQMTIAYGGIDEEYRTLLEQRVEATRVGGGEAQILGQIGIRERWFEAISIEKEWVLFLSDDDPFSLNFLRVLLSDSIRVSDDISMIAPTLFVGITDTATVPRRSVPIIDDSACDRVRKYWQHKDLTGVLYYGLHRRASVNALARSLMRLSYLPSYSDQLLTLRSVADGKLVQCSEPICQVRDESNWFTLEACTATDARHYPVKSMVMFHDLWWFIDLLSVLEDHLTTPAFCEIVANEAYVMLGRMVRAWSRKCEIVGHALTDHDVQLLQWVKSILQWTKESVDMPDRVNGFQKIARHGDAVRARMLSGAE